MVTVAPELGAHAPKARLHLICDEQPACGMNGGGYPSASMYNPNVPQTAYLLPAAAGPQTVAVDPLKTH